MVKIFRRTPNGNLELVDADSADFQPMDQVFDPLTGLTPDPMLDHLPSGQRVHYELHFSTLAVAPSHPRRLG